MAISANNSKNTKTGYDVKSAVWSVMNRPGEPVWAYHSPAILTPSSWGQLEYKTLIYSLLYMEQHTGNQQYEAG